MDRKKRIYRVIPFYRIIDMFEKKQNTLSKPRLWNDPFENFILKSKALMRDGKYIEFGMRDLFYGQCWTLHRESDAMWRIYSQDTNGVKITTTIRKLYESLFNVVSARRRDLSCFIGRVKYLSFKDIQNYLKNPINLESSGAGIVDTLLIKRKAFSHEKEIRLLYWADDNEAKSELYAYEIDPHDLIDEIVFDSRLNTHIYNIFHDYLKNKMKYEGKIIQSGLYKAPEQVFTKIS